MKVHSLPWISRRALASRSGVTRRKEEGTQQGWAGPTSRPLLFSDLESRVLLDETLVICISEHGSTPQLTKRPGGRRVLATAVHLLGIDPHTTVPDRLNRPIPIAGAGAGRGRFLRCERPSRS